MRRGNTDMIRALCIALLGTVLVQPVRAQEQQKDPKQECAERLKALGSMCLLYAQEHDGKLPESLSALYYQAYVNDLAEFACPATETTIEGRTEIDEKAGYVLAGAQGAQALVPIVQDRSPDNHGGEGINVFSSDGKVRWQAEGGSPPPPPQPPGAAGSGNDPVAAGPPPVAAMARPDLYITNVRPMSIHDGPMGRTRFDRSVTGGGLRIGDTAFGHGIGTHAPSEIEYSIGGLGFAAFVAYVGIDHAAAAGQGSCMFQVFVDGEERYNSGIVRNGDAPRPVRADVGGARTLKLVVDDAGDGTQGDYADWVEAGFLTALPVPEPGGPAPGPLPVPPAPDTPPPGPVAVPEPAVPPIPEPVGTPPTPVPAPGWTDVEKPKWWIAEGGPITDARLCTDIVDGQPVGVGMSFPSTATKVGLYVEFQGAREGSTFVVAWNRGERRLLRGLLLVEGPKRAIFYIYPAKSDSFKPGRYHAEVLHEKKSVAKLEFELTAVPQEGRP